MRLWLYFYYYGKYISHDDECSYLRVLVEDNGETNTHVIPSIPVGSGTEDSENTLYSVTMVRHRT